MLFRDLDFQGNRLLCGQIIGVARSADLDLDLVGLALLQALLHCDFAVLGNGDLLVAADLLLGRLALSFLHGECLRGLDHSLFLSLRLDCLCLHGHRVLLCACH